MGRELARGLWHCDHLGEDVAKDLVLSFWAASVVYASTCWLPESKTFCEWGRLFRMAIADA